MKAHEPERVHLPSKMNIDEGDLPSIKDWQVGRTYTMLVKARLMNMKKNDPALVAQGDTDADEIHSELYIESVKELPEEKNKEVMKGAVKELKEKKEYG